MPGGKSGDDGIVAALRLLSRLAQAGEEGEAQGGSRGKSKGGKGTGRPGAKEEPRPRCGSPPEVGEGRFRKQRPFWACKCGYAENFKDKVVCFVCKAPRGAQPPPSSPPVPPAPKTASSEGPAPPSTDGGRTPAAEDDPKVLAQAALAQG